MIGLNGGTNLQAERDQRRPLLSRGDGPVHQLRKWYSQFYPKPSVTEGELHDAE